MNRLTITASICAALLACDPAQPNAGRGEDAGAKGDNDTDVGGGPAGSPSGNCPDCAAPPPGCGYTAPATGADGCPINCGELTCTDEDGDAVCGMYGSCPEGMTCPEDGVGQRKCEQTSSEW